MFVCFVVCFVVCFYLLQTNIHPAIIILQIENNQTVRVKIMAAPRKFKDSDIINAVNELNKAGKNISGGSLRRIIGTGRPDVLIEQYNKLLASGEITENTKKSGVSEVVEVRDLPREVQQSLDEAVASLKNVVMHCNDIAHNTVENRLSAAIEKAKETQLLAAEEIEVAQAERDSAYNEIEQLKDDAEQLKDEHQVDLDLLDEKLAKRDRENSDLKIELSNTKKSYEYTKSANTDLSRNLDEKTKQCSASEQESLVQKTRYEEVAKQLLAAQEANAGLTKKLDDASTLHTTNAAEIAKLKSQLEDSNNSKEEAIKEAILHEDRANNAFKEVEKFKAQTESAKEQVAELKSSEAQLHERLEKQVEENAEEKAENKLRIKNLESELAKTRS